MKVENMVKLKEEFDYKSLSRRLDIELDKLIAENERQRKYFDDEVERIRVDAQRRIAEAEKSYKIALEVLFSLSLSLTHTHRTFVATLSMVIRWFIVLCMLYCLKL
jgi:hypothetical protein